MALIAIASDKGAPGVTTAALALAAVWPRPVLLAECDQAGGDLVYRFPAAGGGHLDPRRGVLSLAVVARRGMQSQQVWEHVQKLHGGLDVLAGVTNAEQGAGLSLLWGPIGKALAALPQADVIADCGRLGADGPLYDLLIEATAVVLVSKVQVADVIRLRDRASAFAAAAQSRGRRGFGVGVVVVAEHKKFRAALGEVQHVLGQAHAPATVLGGIAHDTKGADLLGGEWGGSLDRTMLIKTAREVAQQLVQGLPPIGDPDAAPPGYPAAPGPPGGSHPGGHPAGGHPAGGYPVQQTPAPPPPAMSPSPPVGRRHAAPAAPPPAEPQPAAAYSAPPPALVSYNAAQPSRPPATGAEPGATRFPGPQPAFASYPGSPGPGPQGPGPQGLGPQGPGPQGPGPQNLGPQSPVPPGPWQPVPAATPDLAAVTLSAPTTAGPTVPGPAVPGPAVSGPTISADAPRTTFNRVLGGRGGRHQADQGPPGGPPDRPEAQPEAQPETRPARHAAPANGRSVGGPGFSRPPMPPLTAQGGPAEAENAENAEDPGWGAAPWQRQGPMGPAGASRPGGE
ncbi:MAG: hypothetical protein ABSB59_34575 [Streptosporangiaceae bacterium]|jgi:hypothetical protein